MSKKRFLEHYGNKVQKKAHFSRLFSAFHFWTFINVHFPKPLGLLNLLSPKYIYYPFWNLKRITQLKILELVKMGQKYLNIYQ